MIINKRLGNSGKEKYYTDISSQYIISIELLVTNGNTKTKSLNRIINIINSKTYKIFNRYHSESQTKVDCIFELDGLHGYDRKACIEKWFSIDGDLKLKL